MTRAGRVALAGILLAASTAWAQGPSPRRTTHSGPVPIPLQPVKGIYGHLMEGRFIRLAAVTYDRRRNEIVILDAGGHRIAIADHRGVPVFSFGSEATLSQPLSIAVDRKGRYLVVDSARPDAVRVFDYDGAPLADLNLSRVPAGKWPKRIRAVATADDGTVFLADSEGPRIVVLGEGGELLAEIVAPPDRDDLLQTPVDLEVAPDGTLVVADQTGLAVQVYERSGRFLRGWGSHGPGASSFSLPGGLAVDRKGRVYVADTLRHDVKVFTADGEYVMNFGGWGQQRGAMNHPVDVASDRQGRVFVAEKIGRRVQIFRDVSLPRPSDRLRGVR